MKRLFSMLMVAVATLISFGQTELPVDPSIRIGKLENGLTYYIRHNDKPAQRAEFYLATNVGAYQEEDDQDGLAHFLEHMCFNGTKNFPDKSLLEYLQSIGAEFGRNINASTGFEHTQYMLNDIPIIREGIIDSCLLVLHDYSHYVTCAAEEIEAERGVILEERRSRRNADWRLFERKMPYYFGDTHMARRTLIGGEEQLKTFKRESLVNFYRKWYNPDMQAVVVVGDFDVDVMEQKIKNTFSSIPAPEVPTVKPIVPVPGNKEPIVAVLTDPEASASMIEVFWKNNALPKEYASTDVALTADVIKVIISMVFSERVAAITASADAPFLYASLGVSSIAEGTDVTMADVSFKDNDYKRALEALYAEVERLKRYGITEGELERAKMKLTSSVERAAEAAPSRTNADFIPSILDHFFKNEYLLDPETELQIVQAVCSQMPAFVFQQVLEQLITDENMIIIYSAPERDGISHPTNEELTSIIEKVKSAEIEAPVEEKANEPLLDADTIKSGMINKEETGIYGSTEWTLDNGVKVVYLPTTHKTDEVYMELVMNGGSSLIETAELPSFEGNIQSMYRSNRGLSKFSGVQLKKMLTGKNVSCKQNIGKTRHGFSVVSTPKDIETAMQLLYLNITAPRYSDEEFRIGINQIKALLPNLEKQPTMKFRKYLTETLYGNHERRKTISAEMVESANIKDIEAVGKRLFSNVAGATVYIVGNIDSGTLKPLVEKYIASLPGGEKGSEWIDHKDYIVSGRVIKDFPIEMETPKSTVLQVYTADMPYSIESDMLMQAAKYYLDMIYVETMRESEGGTYGASVATDFMREPKSVAIMQIMFETNPERAEKLSAMAVAGIEKLIVEGIPADKLDMIKKNMLKNISQERISNIYWLDNLKKAQEYNEDYDSAYENAVNGITSERVVELMKQLVAKNNFVQITLSPLK